MKQVKVNVMIQVTMTEVKGVKYYELGTINKAKSGKSCIVLTSAKTEEPIYVQIQEISEKAREAKYYTDYQLRKLTVIQNPKQATKASTIEKDNDTTLLPTERKTRTKKQS